MTLPNLWAPAHLGAVCDLLTDGAHHSPANERSGDFPYITAKNIKWRSIELSDLTFISREEHERIYKRCPVRQGDILLIKDGATTGVATINDFSYPFSLLSSVALIRPTNDIVDNRFLWHWIRSPEAQHQLLTAMNGSAIRRLTLTTIGNAVVNLPPPAEQRRIVAKLDALTARLARARAELDRVPKLARHLRDTALTSARVTTSTWPLKSINDLALTTFDGPFGSNLKSSDYVDNGARVVRLENIGHLRFISEKRSFISQEKFSALARHRLAADDILFSSFIDREIRVCRYPQLDGEVAINKADCFAIRPNPQVCDVRFLAYMLAAPQTYEDLKSGVHGATRPRIGLSLLRKYQVHVPPIDRQQQVADIIEAAFARADRLEAEAARARALLDRLEAAILTKAFRGELIPQDANDEPASVLLERIRAQRAAAPTSKQNRRAGLERHAVRPRRD